MLALALLRDCLRLTKIDRRVAGDIRRGISAGLAHAKNRRRHRRRGVAVSERSRSDLTGARCIWQRAGIRGKVSWSPEFMKLDGKLEARS